MATYDIEMIPITEWTDEITRELMGAIPGTIELHKNLFNRGMSKLFRVMPSGSIALTQLLNSSDNGAEDGEQSLYIIAYVGQDSSEWGAYVIEQCRQQGIKKIILETAHEAYAKHLQEHFPLKYCTSMYELYTADEHSYRSC